MTGRPFDGVGSAGVLLSRSRGEPTDDSTKAGRCRHWSFTRENIYHFTKLAMSLLVHVAVNEIIP